MGGGNPQYNFPQPFKLPIRLKDVLEQNVDEKYYLSNKLIESLSLDNGGYKEMKPSEPPHEGTASCLTARMRYKGKTIHPYESFYWNTTHQFFHGELGEGIVRCVKCDDSLATLVMQE